MLMWMLPMLKYLKIILAIPLKKKISQPLMQGSQSSVQNVIKKIFILEVTN